MNARQKRLFEEARRKNPELKVPTEAPVSAWSEDDLALIKQGVGDKTSRPAQAHTQSEELGGSALNGERSGSVVTYFEAKGFGFLRPDEGGRDIFFHVSRLTQGEATELRPGTRVVYELGLDRTGKVAASNIRIAPPPE